MVYNDRNSETTLDPTGSGAVWRVARHSVAQKHSSESRATMKMNHYSPTERPMRSVRELLLRAHADYSNLGELLSDRWAAQHPEAVLTHHLEESRAKAAAKRDRRRRRDRHKKRPR